METWNISIFSFLTNLLSESIKWTIEKQNKRRAAKNKTRTTEFKMWRKPNIISFTVLQGPLKGFGVCGVCSHSPHFPHCTFFCLLVTIYLELSCDLDCNQFQVYWFYFNSLSYIELNVANKTMLGFY